ncbi:MAG: hypothetical protein RSC56_08325, partial [Acidaminococcaceae bacterium]
GEVLSTLNVTAATATQVIGLELAGKGVINLTNIMADMSATGTKLAVATGTGGTVNAINTDLDGAIEYDATGVTGTDNNAVNITLDK